MSQQTGFRFDNSYARLPEPFYRHQQPTPVASPGLVRVNRELARELGIDPDWLESSRGLEVLAGNTVPEGAEPISTAYAGHQFGGWNPQLGDGRAVLLGEVVAPDGRRFDVQLKGSGPTPFSRGGDGRAPLGPVLREYVVSEAMAALGIPTSRALAAVTTGETVFRDRPLPGAVLTRVAASHIRVGTFQYFAARENTPALRQLTEHVIDRHYPELRDSDNPPLALLQSVIRRQAALIARWQLVGFIHGVMNTDNMLLTAETVDYGPCAFMDTYNPQTVFSSIDHAGRYAYRNQPGIAQWNLVCLAQCLLPLLDEDRDRAVELAQAAVDEFPGLYSESYEQGLRRKLGLLDGAPPDDRELVAGFFALLQEQSLDYTLAFRRLADLADEDSDSPSVAALFDFPEAARDWLQRWRERLARQQAPAAELQGAMYRANPVFIPRNHRVEAVITAALENDLQPFHDLLGVLVRPFTYDPQLSLYALPPRPQEVVHQTFCGT